MAAEMVEGQEHLAYKKGLKALGLSILGKRRLSWDLIHVHKYLISGSQEDGAKPFSVVLTDRTRRNKLKYGILCWFWLG